MDSTLEVEKTSLPRSAPPAQGLRRIRSFVIEEQRRQWEKSRQISENPPRFDEFVKLSPLASQNYRKLWRLMRLKNARLWEHQASDQRREEEAELKKAWEEDLNRTLEDLLQNIQE